MRILSFVNTLMSSSGVNTPSAWTDANRRLYRYYLTVAPQLPESFKEMEPLFLAVICGCNAGRFVKRCMTSIFRVSSVEMQSFAANTLGARGPLLSVLIHFFEEGRWGSPAKRPSVNRVSLRKIKSSFSCRQHSI